MRELGKRDGLFCVGEEWILETGGLARRLQIPGRSGVLGKSLQLWREAVQEAP